MEIGVQDDPVIGADQDVKIISPIPKAMKAMKSWEALIIEIDKLLTVNYINIIGPDEIYEDFDHRNKQFFSVNTIRAITECMEYHTQEEVVLLGKSIKIKRIPSYGGQIREKLAWLIKLHIKIAFHDLHPKSSKSEIEFKRLDESGIIQLFDELKEMVPIVNLVCYAVSATIETVKLICDFRNRGYNQFEVCSQVKEHYLKSIIDKANSLKISWYPYVKIELMLNQKCPLSYLLMNKGEFTIHENIKSDGDYGSYFGV